MTSTLAKGSPIPVSVVETANVTIGGSPRTIAVNPNAGRVYVADWFSKTLTVVDASSHSVIAHIILPAANNNAIAFDYNANMIYVLVEGGVAEIDGSTNKVVGELPLNLGPGALAYDPSTHVIYGSSPPQPQNMNQSLVGVDVRTGSIVANISLGFWADSLALNPKTHMVYAAGCAGSFTSVRSIAMPVECADCAAM